LNPLVSDELKLRQYGPLLGFLAMECDGSEVESLGHRHRVPMIR
jgi:hypothetical protein